MMLADIVKVISQDGAAVVGFAVLLSVGIANNRASNRRADLMLERLLHGDGNGGASIAKATEAAREARDTSLSAVGLAKAADEKADLALTEAKAIRSEVVKIRTDGCSQLVEHRRVLAEGGSA